MLTGPQNNNMNMLNEFEGITITTFKGLVEMQSRSLFSSQIWKEKYLIVEDGYMYFLEYIPRKILIKKQSFLFDSQVRNTIYHWLFQIMQ